MGWVNSSSIAMAVQSCLEKGSSYEQFVINKPAMNLYGQLGNGYSWGNGTNQYSYNNWSYSKLAGGEDASAYSASQIVEKLGAYGISAERKTLYQDFELLRDFGFDIIGQQARRNFYYHMGNRRFELPELKLLVDSVQSAKFITDKKYAPVHEEPVRHVRRRRG